MAGARHHRLEGLAPDNFLAFLALLGLLRALDTARPEWRARAFWDLAAQPVRPVLVLTAPADQDAIVSAAAEGIVKWGIALRSLAGRVSEAEGKSDDAKSERMTSLTDDPKVLKRVTQQALPEIEELLLECLCCEAPPRRRASAAPSGTPQPHYECRSTGLKFCSGQMAFVGAMLTLTQTATTNRSAVRDSLFAPWTYRKKGLSLRYSPAEAKRYALQADDPSPHGAWTEEGATTLAVLGLASFPIVIGRNNAATTAMQEGSIGTKIRWPIWSSATRRGWSLAGVASVLRHEDFAKETPGRRWKAQMEIIWIMEAAVFKLNNEGNYRNVTPAHPVAEGGATT